MSYADKYTPAQWPGFSTDRIVIPCGHCSFCLKNRRDEWTIRLLEEFKDSLECIFLTLTYSDESVHYDGNVHKEHIQKFWKRLRKRLGSRQIRYYAVGEYGTKTFRPHYHAIVSGINANFYDILADALS